MRHNSNKIKPLTKTNFVSYIKIMKIQNEIDVRRHELDVLKPKAVRELCSGGFTYDQIKVMLKMGKDTVRRLIKNKKAVMRKRKEV